MRKKTRMTAGMKRKMTGTKSKIARTTKTTKPEKHMGLAGNGGPFLLRVSSKAGLHLPV